MQDKKPNLSFLYDFGSLCYPINDHEDLGKFDAKADIGIFVGYAPAKKTFRIYNRRTRIITETIHVTFDELTEMASEQFSSGPGLHFQEAAALRAEVLADSPMSTSINQDAPSTSIPSSQEQDHSPIISQGFEESPKIWTKDHPIANVIGDPSRSVSMRKQLKTDAMWCYFDAFLTLVEPKNFKQAMTEMSWIDAMQEKFMNLKDLKFGHWCRDNPSHVYKLKMALYCLKQAPRAWYDMLSSFLISQQFSKGAVDPTLFTRHAGNDLLLLVDLTLTMMSAYVPDADHAGCQDTRRSTSGSAQFLGDKDVSWSSKKIPRRLTPREPTFQVILDVIALTPCYPAFLITTDVPEVYMHQFWNSIYKHDNFYRLKLDKKKRFKLTMEVFRDIFQICPRVPGRDFDALPSKEDTMSFLRELGHTGEINSLNDINPGELLLLLSTGKNVDYVELLWEYFINQIENRVYKKQEKMYYPRFTKVIIHHFLIQDKSLSWRNRIEMHTSKNDYLINTLRFVSAKEATQIYEAILPECLTSPAMKESKAYKTYLGYATGVVPPKIARNFKKASPSKKDSDLVPVDEEPVQKGKRVKRPAKKSTTTPAAGIVIKEAHVETNYKRKEKEKVDVAHGKGIELLSDVALTEEAQMKEVRKKSLRDFYKTHPSGSGTVVEKPPRVEKIIPTVTSKGTGDKPGVLDVTKDDSNESESESWEQKEESDDDQEEEEFVHTPSPTDDKDDDNSESKSDDVIEGDEEMDDTTNQFDDDVDARLNEPSQNDREVIQNEGADAQQRNENVVTTQEQVIEDAHVTISTVTKKTVGSVTSSSRSSDLASKFINFLDIPHADAEIVSPLDVHVHHEVPRTHAPTLLTAPVSVITDFTTVFRFNDRITALEKEVVELKKDPLHTQVTTLVDEHLDTRLGETREEFMNFLSESLTARIKEQVKDQLPQILPKEVSNFAPPVIEALIKESRDEVTLAKVSSQPQSTYEAASTLTEFELKKILIDKIEKSESYLAAPEHRDCYDSLKKSYNLEKYFFFSYDVYTMKRGRQDKDKDEDPSAGSDRGLKRRKTSKDADSTIGPKDKDSKSRSSKSSKSKPKSGRKSVQSEEPEFEVADSDTSQDQVGNLDDNDDEPRKEDASRCDWFKKPTPLQEPTDPDWHEGKTPQKGPT
ncbi:copia protein [Tanacetum coccineum]